MIQAWDEDDPLKWTAITLTNEERAVLEALSRSTKSEARMQLRARIALLAADGRSSREIGRIVGCTTGTASKWRVRYARDHRAGLDETGNRGAAPRYGPADQKRILAMLDQPPTGGIFQLDRTAAVARVGRHSPAIYLALPACPEDRSVGPQVLV